MMAVVMRVVVMVIRRGMMLVVVVKGVLAVIGVAVKRINVYFLPFKIFDTSLWCVTVCLVVLRLRAVLRSCAVSCSPCWR